MRIPGWATGEPVPGRPLPERLTVRGRRDAARERVAGLRPGPGTWRAGTCPCRSDPGWARLRPPPPDAGAPRRGASLGEGRRGARGRRARAAGLRGRVRRQRRPRDQPAAARRGDADAARRGPTCSAA